MTCDCYALIESKRTFCEGSIGHADDHTFLEGRLRLPVGSELVAKVKAQPLPATALLSAAPVITQARTTVVREGVPLTFWNITWFLLRFLVGLGVVIAGVVGLLYCIVVNLSR